MFVSVKGTETFKSRGRPGVVGVVSTVLFLNNNTRIFIHLLSHTNFQNIQTTLTRNLLSNRPMIT